MKVAIDKSIVAIAAGVHHSLALSDTGELWTWGYNDDGRLGIGNTNKQLQPVKVNLGFEIPKNANFSCSDAAGFVFSACASSGGSAIPCLAQFLKIRSDVACSAGAKEAQECDAGTYCPAGTSHAITCPGGHFCHSVGMRPFYKYVLTSSYRHNLFPSIVARSFVDEHKCFMSFHDG